MSLSTRLSHAPPRLLTTPIAVVLTSEAGESPNKLRVKQLSDKLGALQDELEQEKQVTRRRVIPPSLATREARTAFGFRNPRRVRVCISSGTLT